MEQSDFHEKDRRFRLTSTSTWIEQKDYDHLSLLYELLDSKENIFSDDKTIPDFLSSYRAFLTSNDCNKARRGTLKYTCKVCDEIYSRKSTYEGHLKEIHNNVYYKHNVNNTSTRNGKKHYEISPAVSDINCCKDTMLNPVSNLSRKRQRKKKPTQNIKQSEEGFLCLFCPKRFMKKVDYEHHKKVHSNNDLILDSKSRCKEFTKKSMKMKKNIIKREKQPKQSVTLSIQELDFNNSEEGLYSDENDLLTKAKSHYKMNEEKQSAQDNDHDTKIEFSIDKIKLLTQSKPNYKSDKPERNRIYLFKTSNNQTNIGRMLLPVKRKHNNIEIKRTENRKLFASFLNKYNVQPCQVVLENIFQCLDCSKVFINSECFQAHHETHALINLVKQPQHRFVEINSRKRSEKCYKNNEHFDNVQMYRSNDLEVSGVLTVVSVDEIQEKVDTSVSEPWEKVDRFHNEPFVNSTKKAINTDEDSKEYFVDPYEEPQETSGANVKVSQKLVVDQNIENFEIHNIIKPNGLQKMRIRKMYKCKQCPQTFYDESFALDHSKSHENSDAYQGMTVTFCAMLVNVLDIFVESPKDIMMPSPELFVNGDVKSNESPKHVDITSNDSPEEVDITYNESSDIPSNQLPEDDNMTSYHSSAEVNLTSKQSSKKIEIRPKSPKQVDITSYYSPEEVDITSNESEESNITSNQSGEKDDITSYDSLDEVNVISKQSPEKVEIRSYKPIEKVAIASYESSEEVEVIFPQRRAKMLARRFTNMRQYECYICRKVFPNRNKNIFLDHCNTHFPHKCTFCTSSFMDGRGLENHQKHYNNYKCLLCNKENILLSNLEKHKKDHIKNGAELTMDSIQKMSCMLDFECPVCRRVFHIKSYFIKHMKIVHLEHKCRYCGKQFQRKGNLKRHEQFHVNENIKTKILYNSTEDRMFKCIYCYESFKVLEDLLTHLEAHNHNDMNTYNITSYESSNEVHISYESCEEVDILSYESSKEEAPEAPEAPEEIDITLNESLNEIDITSYESSKEVHISYESCEEVDILSYELSKEEAPEAPEAPEEIDITLDESLNEIDIASYESSEEDVITQNESYKCYICGKAFHNKYEYVSSKHSEIHFPHKCTSCTSCFMNGRGLENHRKRHNKFKCLVCNKENIHSFEIQKHKEKHINTGDKLTKFEFLKINCKLEYECYICGKVFRWRYNIKRHIKISHSGVCHEKQHVLELRSVDEFAISKLNEEMMNTVEAKMPEKCNRFNLLEVHPKKQSHLSQGDTIIIRRVYECTSCFQIFFDQKLGLDHLKSHDAVQKIGEYPALVDFNIERLSCCSIKEDLTNTVTKVNDLKQSHKKYPFESTIHSFEHKIPTKISLRKTSLFRCTSCGLSFDEKDFEKHFEFSNLYHCLVCSKEDIPGEDIGIHSSSHKKSKIYFARSCRAKKIE